MGTVRLRLKRDSVNQGFTLYCSCYRICILLIVDDGVHLYATCFNLVHLLTFVNSVRQTLMKNKLFYPTITLALYDVCHINCKNGKNIFPQTCQCII